MFRLHDKKSIALAIGLISVLLGNFYRSYDMIHQNSQFISDAVIGLNRNAPIRGSGLLVKRGANSTNAERRKQEFNLRKKVRLILPNVLLIGTQKAGTTAVANWLFTNGVCNPRSFDQEAAYHNKEVQFFDQDERFRQGIDFYAKRFEHCAEDNRTELILDATPNTIERPQRVHDTYNQEAAGNSIQLLKLIAILREPISRELSVFNHKVFDYERAHDKKDGWFADILHDNGSLMSFVNYTESVLKKRIEAKMPFYTFGLYEYHLKKWTTLFHRDQLLILSYDELRMNPSKVQWRIEQFLGKKFKGVLSRSNESEGPSKQKEIHMRVKMALEPIFNESNRALYRFLRENPGPPMEQNPFPPFISV